MTAINTYWKNADRIINQAIIGYTKEDYPKDAHCNLMESLLDTEAATGYDAEFLHDEIMNCIADGDTDAEAITSVITIAFERDY